ncbi:MAG: MarR family transcriptional regulator [Reichenbachiella sp.]
MGLSDDIKSSKFNSQKSKAMVNILFTHNWFRDIFKVTLKKYDLLPQHYNVLRIVKGKFPEPITPGEIKNVMLDKGPDVTRLMDKLVKMDLVNRCQDEENRRVVQIRMNEKGLELLTHINKEMEVIENNSFGLSEDEARLLSDLLDKSRIK